VPTVLGYDMSLGYILLEDLGDLTLERRFFENQDFAQTLPYYYKSIDEILKIHQIQIDKTNKTPFFHIEFDTEKLLWELNYMKKNLLEDFFNLEMTEEFKSDLESNFTKICNHLSHLPQVVCHRDYHSRNIMLHKDQTYVIDFQDARLGPCQYDLVSLLRDSYVDLTLEQENLLLKYYFDKMPKEITQDWDTFIENYKLQILQRTLKACGSFSSFYNQKKDTRYIKHIQPTLIKTKKILSELKGNDALKILFSEYHIEAIESVKL
jgi:N-acetylmuramate 1-kinase